MNKAVVFLFYGSRQFIFRKLVGGGNKKKICVHVCFFPFTRDQYRLQNVVCIISIY